MPEVINEKGIRFSNFATAELVESLSDSGDEIIIESDKASLFPTPGENQFFKVVLVKIDEDDEFEYEIVRVNERDENVLKDLERGEEGTTAKSFSQGDFCEVRLTAETLGKGITTEIFVSDEDPDDEIGEQGDIWIVVGD